MLVLLLVIYITYIHILYVISMNVSSFTTSLIMSLPYNLVTVLIWRNTFVLISRLLTNINSIIVESVITFTATVTTYSIAIAVIFIHISVLIKFIMEQKTNVIIVKLETVFSFNHIIWIICPEFMISLYSVSSLA